MDPTGMHIIQIFGSEVIQNIIGNLNPRLKEKFLLKKQKMLGVPRLHMRRPY